MNETRSVWRSAQYNYLQEKSEKAKRDIEGLAAAINADNMSDVIFFILGLQDAVKSLTIGGKRLLKENRISASELGLRDL